MCEKDNTLKKGYFVIIYAGYVMEDRFTIRKYDVFNGASVHLFKKIKEEYKEGTSKCVDYSSTGMAKLGVALRSLSLNNSYKCVLKEMNEAKMLSDHIISIPGLSRDPVAITLLQHPELLVDVNDSSVQRIAESHPSLALAAIQIYEVVHDQVAQLISFISSKRPESATVLENLTTQQQQPITSGASTSTANTINVPVIPNITHQLRIMREMGFCNEALNIQALQLGGGCLGIAIYLVLSGFNILD